VAADAGTACLFCGCPGRGAAALCVVLSLSAPQIEILGVYRLPVTEDLFREQHSILYADSDPVAEKRCRDQLASTVLVEVLLRNRDESFDLGDFTQPQEGVPRENWQAPWAEAYLTLDGEALATERWSSPPQTEDLRVAFFLHYWQPNAVLRSSYGDLSCPAVREMPERLGRLVPYEPVD